MERDNDLEIHDNLAAFLDEVEPDEKKRAALIKRVAPLIRLGPSYETTEDGLDFQSDAPNCCEWVARKELPEDPLPAAVIRRYKGEDNLVNLYDVMKHVADHLREVAIGMADPNWGIIRHAYIETRHLEKWVNAVKGDDAAPLEEGEKDKLLRQIGVLALAFAAKTERYRIGERPNANSIADAVQEVLQGMPDVKDRGLRVASIRGSIKEGIARLNK